MLPAATLGLNFDSRKEVLSFAIGENESAKFWLNALNELKNRGVQDVMIICADGLAGIKEAILPPSQKQITSAVWSTWFVTL